MVDWLTSYSYEIRDSMTSMKSHMTKPIDKDDVEAFD